METEEVKGILIELVNLVAALEEEVRSLQVLTTHRVDHTLTDKLGIPQKSNALHARVESLRTRVNNLAAENV
jgi:polyhydroxyalkanoate synthesis regulator phasin